MIENIEKESLRFDRYKWSERLRGTAGQPDGPRVMIPTKMRRTGCVQRSLTHLLVNP